MRRRGLGIVGQVLGVAIGFALGLLAPAPMAQAAKDGDGYRTGGDCDGYPRVAVQTAAPLCVGLVARGLGFARGVAAIGDDIFVVDMGAWGSRGGRLLHLPDRGRGTARVVLRNLFQPNGLVRGPARTLLLGITGQVVQVDPLASDPAATVKTIVAGLPSDGRHPLPALAVAGDGTIYVNVGAASNNCESADGRPPDPEVPCPELLETPPRAAILRVPPAGALPHEARSLPVHARGLRNSMAMTVLPDGRLLAAVNARDSINRLAPALSDAALPHDTLQLIEPGGDHGWPSCYDRNLPSPEYPKADCRGKVAPTLLLPAHAAPLGMLLLRGQRLPGLAGRVLIGYHGYRSTGHRIVALALDARHRPQGQPVDVVKGWTAMSGSRPQGAPVSLFEMDDGSVLISEDRNGTLLRLSASGTR